MDVRLSLRKFFSWITIGSLFLSTISCGRQLDIDTQHGRDARKDEANQLLSKGYCQLAQDTIKDLYASTYNDEETTIIMSSTYACLAGFNFLTMAGYLSSMSNRYQALARSMPTANNNSANITYMYSAVDVLSQGNTLLDNGLRTTAVNRYMVFLQLALIGSIMSAYGAPSTTTGVQTANLSYGVTLVAGRGASDMTNVDACAISAGFSTILDSSASITGNSDITSAVSSISSACTSAGYTCTAISRNRKSCTGIAGNTASIEANAIVTALNSAW